MLRAVILVGQPKTSVTFCKTKLARDTEKRPFSSHCLHRLDLLGHDLGKVTAHAQSTYRTMLSQRRRKYVVVDFKAL